MPFSGGKKTRFFSVLNNQKNKTKKKKQNKKNNKNKKGGFRAKWGGPLGHLTWPLNPPKKQKNKTKNKKQKQKKK